MRAPDFLFLTGPTRRAYRINDVYGAVALRGLRLGESEETRASHYGPSGARCFGSGIKRTDRAGTSRQS